MEILFEALANAADGAFAIDEDQRIVYWNKVAQELLGYTSDEVIGRPCYEILAGRDERDKALCRYHCYVANTALTGSPVTTYDTFARTKSGKMRWISVSILTFPAADDVSSLVVHLFRDASQKKQNEEFAQRVLGAVESVRDDRDSSLVLPGATDSRAKDLTDRELEVLSLLAQGLGTRDIAQSLSISLSTARNHIQNILHKLDVHSRLEAVAYAFEHGLVSND